MCFWLRSKLAGGSIIELALGIEFYRPTAITATSLPATQAGDDGKEATDFIGLSREPTIQREGADSPLNAGTRRIKK